MEHRTPPPMGYHGSDGLDWLPVNLLTRLTTMSLHTHWVCFDCRKSFHYQPATKEAPRNRKCPECNKPMCDMGIYFEPPPSRAKKAWAIMDLLSRSGYRFPTEGSKAYVDSVLMETKRPSIEGVRRRIEHQRELAEGVPVRRVDKTTRKLKGRHRPITH